MCMFDIWYMKNCGKSYKESETEVHSPVCSSDTIAFYCHSKSFWNKIWWANFVHFVYKKAHNIQALPSVVFLQNYNHIHVYHTFLYFKHFNIRRVRVLSLCLIFLLFTGWCDLVFFFFNLNLGPVKKCINVVGDTQIPPRW